MALYIYQIMITRTMAEAVADAQKMHELLTRLVGESRKDDHLLYRLDTDHGLLFVQSDKEPEKTRDLKLLHKLDTDSIAESLSDGAQVSFLLRTNVKKKYDGRPHYVPQDEVIPVMTEKLRRCGLEPVSVQDGGKVHTSIKHRAEKGGYAEITLHDIIARCIVKDRDTFAKAWHEGIGGHRAYGSGLLVMTR